MKFCLTLTLFFVLASCSRVVSQDEFDLLYHNVSTYSDVALGKRVEWRIGDEYRYIGQSDGWHKMRISTTTYHEKSVGLNVEYVKARAGQKAYSKGVFASLKTSVLNGQCKYELENVTLHYLSGLNGLREYIAKDPVLAELIRKNFGKRVCGTLIVELKKSSGIQLVRDFSSSLKKIIAEPEP